MFRYLVPKSENLSPTPSAVLHYTSKQSNCSVIRWKTPSWPKFTHQKEFSSKENACQGNLLVRLCLILKLIGERERPQFMLILVADEKGRFLFSFSPNVKALSPLPLVKKGVILQPHSTCVRRKPLLKSLHIHPSNLPLLPAAWIILILPITKKNLFFLPVSLPALLCSVECHYPAALIRAQWNNLFSTELGDCHT